MLARHLAHLVTISYSRNVMVVGTKVRLEATDVEENGRHAAKKIHQPARAQHLPKVECNDAGLTRPGNKAGELDVHGSNIADCGGRVYEYLSCSERESDGNEVRDRGLISIGAVGGGQACLASLLTQPYHGLVHHPLFLFQNFSSGETEGPLLYSRGFLPSFSRFRAEWPLLCRFLTQLPRS